jgi:hypothetical protein
LSIKASGELPLDPTQAEVLALDAAAFARALSDPTSSARYERLAAAAATESKVPEDLIGSLETMLELVFEKGRPSNRAVLQAIFAMTPRGRERSSAAREVNEALRTLAGQRLEEVRITAGPSQHTLVLETDRCRLTLELDANGARVASLET